MRTRASPLPIAAARELFARIDEVLSERALLWSNVLSATEDAMRDLPTPSAARSRNRPR